jgi:hypothetical protein
LVSTNCKKEGFHFSPWIYSQEKGVAYKSGMFGWTSFLSKIGTNLVRVSGRQGIHDGASHCMMHPVAFAPLFLSFLERERERHREREREREREGWWGERIS